MALQDSLEGFQKAQAALIIKWDNISPSFVSYFSQQWLNQYPPKTWALCYRIPLFEVGEFWVNTNNKLER